MQNQVTEETYVKIFGELMQEHSAKVLDNSITYLTESMILDYLAKHGSITLEESELFCNMVTKVITEASSDFIPEEVDVPDAAAVEDDSLRLFDQAGNEYVFQDGQLIPLETEVPAEGEEIPAEGEGEPEEIAAHEAHEASETPEEEAAEHANDITPAIEPEFDPNLEPASTKVDPDDLQESTLNPEAIATIEESTLASDSEASVRAIINKIITNA